MVEDQKHTKAEGDQIPAVDAFDAYLASALAESALPPPSEELDSATAAESLTEEDREALSAMGSALDLVNRVVTRAQATDSAVSTDASTVSLQGEQSSTRTPSPHSNLEKHGDAELLRSLKAFELEELISWPSRYRKIRELGRGGQGVVYLCECLDEFGPRALKTFSPVPYGDAALYGEEMRRMEHVASLVHRISCENVVDVDRLANFDGIRVMVMRWVDGYDLQRLLRPELLERIRVRLSKKRWDKLNNVVVRYGPEHLRLQPGIAVSIIQDCLQGLDALHRRGIVHGDIKPSNIMLNSYGNAKLIDMGSAFEMNSRPKQHTWTPQYAAPEVLESRIALRHGHVGDVPQDKNWSTQSDLASLGYVLIELLAGRPAIAIPNVGEDSTWTAGDDVDPETLQTMLDAKRSLPDRLPQLVPSEFRKAERLMRLCRRLTHPDPAKRVPDAHEAIEGHDGTVAYIFDLIHSNFGAAFRCETQRWIEDVKKTEELKALKTHADHGPDAEDAFPSLSNGPG